MNNFSSKIAAAIIATMAIFSTSSFASIITHDFSVLGWKTSPGAIGWNFNSTGGAANLEFELAGHRSLDGYNNCCTDTFHLALNGTEIFTGSFNMGGGGSNKILFNPYGGTALTTTYGATGNVHNSRQTTWMGGVTQIALPFNLLTGVNQLDFKYTGYPQAPNDEGWGVNLAKITTSTTYLPESNSLILLMIGLLGMTWMRRKNV